MVITTLTLQESWQAQIHRETYIAVIQGQLRQHGSKQEFARKIGIAPQYLSNLLNPFDHRTPGVDTARRIAAALRLTRVERNDLVDHMTMAKGRPLHFGEFGPQPAERAALSMDVYRRIQDTRRAAKFAGDPRLAAALDRQVWREGMTFLAQVPPMRRPIVWAGIALLLVELAHAANRHSYGLYLAKWAGAVLSAAEMRAPDETVALYEELFTNALVIEASALHYLYLHDAALVRLEQAAQSPDAVKRPGFWLPHINRVRLNALAMTPRAAMRDVQELVRRGLDACGVYHNASGPLLALLLQRGLAAFHVRRARLHQAVQVMEPWLPQLDALPMVGPLHRVLLMVDYAQVLYKCGELDAWRDVMVQALTLGVAANLKHPLTALQRIYPRHWPELLEEVDSMVATALSADSTTSML